jgi:glycosyltransferase involved in cell wall biosynthesis
MGDDPRRPAVLHMCLSPGWGGLEMYPVRTVPRLIERGLRVVTAGRPGTKTGDALAALGTPHLDLTTSFLRLLGVPRLARFVRDHGVGLIHCHKSSDLRTAAPAARMTGAHLVFTEHMGARRPKRDPWHRWIYRHVDRVFSINDEVRRRNLGALPLPAERIHTLHYGVDLREYTPRLDEGERLDLRRSLGVPDGAPLILLAGRLALPKGQVEFVEAAALTRDELPEARFIVAGGLAVAEGADPGFPEELQRLVAERGLAGRVLFTGFRRDLARILECATVACVPSWDEAFGMVVIEAMSLGVPVVGTRAGGIPELVDEGVDGSLVPPRDAAALGRALVDLARDPVRARTMGAHGRAKVEERFSLDLHMDRLIAHYEAVLGSSLV